MRIRWLGTLNRGLLQDKLSGEPPQFPNISAVCQITSEFSKDGVYTVYLVLCSHFHTTKRVRCGLYAFKFSADGTVSPPVSLSHPATLSGISQRL